MSLTADASMKRSIRTKLVWSDEWAVEPGDGPLILSAGGDLRLSIEGTDQEIGGLVRGWANGEGIDPAAEPGLTDHLLTIGALTLQIREMPRVQTTAQTEASLRPIADQLAQSPRLEIVNEEGDLTVVFLPHETSLPRGPHMGVDVGNHHTLVLGPLVVPGISACLMCLETRMRRRWPLATVPAFPAVRSNPAVVAELVAIQIELFTQGRSPLINATIAWDLERGRVDRQTLLKVPGCPTCDQYEHSGKTGLPWEPR